MIPNFVMVKESYPKLDSVPTTYLFIPSIIDTTVITVATPMITPRSVKNDLNRLDQRDDSAIEMLSIVLIKTKRIADIVLATRGCLLVINLVLGGGCLSGVFITLDLPVKEVDDTLSESGNYVFVCDDDDRVAILVEFFEELHDLITCLRV